MRNTEVYQDNICSDNFGWRKIMFLLDLYKMDKRLCSEKFLRQNRDKNLIEFEDNSIRKILSLIEKNMEKCLFEKMRFILINREILRILG